MVLALVGAGPIERYVDARCMDVDGDSLHRPGASSVQAVHVTTSATDRSPGPQVVPVELAAAAYFVLQAAFGVLLWVGADASDVVRSWLELVSERPQVTDGFLPADAVVIASSALAAWALWRGRSWAMVPVWFTVGGIVYPTVYLVGWVATTDGTGEIALAMMLLASVLCCGAALVAWRSRHRP
jgi:hypothetical protein